MRQITQGALLLRQSVSGERRMTQVQLAEHLDVSQQAVSAWIRGTSRPDFRRQILLQDLFGIHAADWEIETTDGDAA